MQTIRSLIREQLGAADGTEISNEELAGLIVDSITPGQMIRALCQQSHKANEKWWHDPKTGERLEGRNVGELLMLCVSELAEAMEGHRKNLQDDKLPHRKMLEVELVDCLIRIFDLGGAPEMGLDLGGAFDEKTAYNAVRKDHTHEARLADGGKRY